MNLLIIFAAKYLIAIIAMIAVIVWLQLDKQKQAELIALAILSLPLIFIISRVAALLYFNARPFAVGHFTPLIPHAADNGFPSDHTLLSAAIAALVLPYSRKIGVLLMILAIAVGGARVLAQVHHSIDIIGSIVISSGITSFAYYILLPKFLNSNCHTKLCVILKTK